MASVEQNVAEAAEAARSAGAAAEAEEEKEARSSCRQVQTRLQEHYWADT